MGTETNTTNIQREVDPIMYLKNVDSRLSEVIDRIGPIDFHHYHETSPFVFLSREIIGQMISAKVKKTIYQRFMNLCDGDISPEKISRLTILELRSIGLSTSKSTYLINLANVVLEGQISFDELTSDDNDTVMKKLTAIRGIGKWTASMYLLFFLGREDVLPVEDGAFLQAYKWLYNTEDIKPSSIKAQCKCWSPFSSLASRYMYRALDTGLTKIDINEFLNKK